MNLRVLAFAALCLSLLQSLRAAPITIPIGNPGFDALRGTDPAHFSADGTLLAGHSSLLPAFPQGPTTYATTDPIPQWTVSGIGGTFVPVPGTLPPGGPAARSWAYLDPNGALTQQLLSTVQGGTVYRIQVDIGAPSGVTSRQYTFALTAGNTVLARQTGLVAAGEMATITLPVLVKSDSSLVGSQLGIVLGNLSTGSGSVLFDNVRLTQEPAQGCFQLPTGVVGFWKGDDLMDSVGGPVGSFRSDAQIGPGFVGSGFVFPGRQAAVVLSPFFLLDSQEFSVESWIRRADPGVASADPEAGQFFGGSANGFTVGITHTGLLYLSHIGVVSFYSTTAVRDTGWHHVAVTRSGGALRFYLDGALHDTVPCAVNFDLSGPYAIGGLGTPFNGVAYGFLGSIDELGVYNRAIADSEVAAIYQASVAGRCLPSTRFGADPTPKFIDSQAVSVFRAGITNDGPGALLNLKLRSGFLPGAGIVSMSSSAGTVAIEQGVPTATVPVVAAGQSVTIEVAAAADSSTMTYLTNQASATFQQDGIQFGNGPVRSFGRVVAPSALLPSGMVAWWPAENSTADVWGTSSGLLSGHAGYATGLVGKAFSFDGTDSSVQLGSATALKIQDLTIETWIKRASGTLISQSPGIPACILGGGINSYAFAFVPDGHLTFSQVGVSRIDSSAAILDTEWHHVAVTRSGTQVHFYIDGADAGGGVYSSALTFDSPFVIGSLGQVAAGVGTEPFWGLIDELSVYNRALSQGEVQGVFRSLYNGKTTGAVDLTGSVVTAQPVVLGAFIDYQFRVQNNSASPATGYLLNQPVPAGWSVLSAVANVGSAVVTGGNLSWDLGPLGPGIAATLSVRIAPSAAGDSSVVATLSGGAGAAKVKALSMSVVSQPVVVSPPAVRLIAPVGAEIPATGTNRVQIGVSLDKVSATAVSIDYGVYPVFKAGVHVVEAIYGTAVVPPGALQSAIPLPLVAGTTADMGSLFVQVIAVRGGATPPEGTLIIPVKAPYAADLAVSASPIQAAIRPGGLVSGTIRVTNRGTGAASQVRLTNSLPAGWVVAGLTPSSGTTSVAGDSFVWDLGGLDPAASASLTFSARPTTLGSGVLTASVGTPSTDLDASNNRIEYAFALSLLPEVNLGADVSVTAPSSGVLSVPVPVRLSDPAGGAVVVTYATVDGTAIAGRDFKPLEGTLTIPAGEVLGSLPLEILGGRAVVDDLSFQVRLTDVTGAAFGRTNLAVVVSHLVVADLAATVESTASQGFVNEGLPLRFAVGNLGPAVATAPRGTLAIPAGWTVRKATASDGSVQTVDGQLVWSPGVLAAGKQTTLDLEVAAASPGTGRFALTVSGPEPDLQPDNNAASVDLRADAIPEVRIGSDLSVPVPLSVSRVASVQVSLSAASFRPVSIDFTTADGTAASGRDYQVSAGTLNFPAGITVQTVPINVLPNPNAGTNTTFSVRLSNPVGAQLGRDSVVVTLLGEPAQVSVQRFDPKAGEFAVRIHAVPGRVYELQKATSLDANEWSFVSDASVATGEADVELSDPFAGEAPFAFYRVVVTSR